MKKLITTTFLLVLASVSYGQELIYLHCTENPDKPLFSDNQPARVLVLSNESETWDYFFLFSDELLEFALDAGNINDRSRIFSGTLNRRIISTTSDSYTLGTLRPSSSLPPEFFFRLDRISGNLYLMSDTITLSTCSPIDKALLENLLQERIDRRDEMIRANEASRLF